MADNSPLDVELEDLQGLHLDTEQATWESGELGRFILRTFTVLFVVVTGISLVILVHRRGRGSWKETLAFVSVQIVWQVVAWYTNHIDSSWVHSLDCPTIDCEYKRKIVMFVENLFHGAAVYTGIALVGRLEGVVGVLLWILGIMSISAPLIFAVIILLLDLTLTSEKRAQYITQISVAVAKTLWFNIIPTGLLTCWLLGQCVHGFSGLRSSSSRMTASRIIAAVLVVFHLLHFTHFLLYVVTKNISIDQQLVLLTPNAWLLEVGYLFAGLGIPGAWLLGLLIPRRDSISDATEMNLKLAKQNKNRNKIKYKKEKVNVATPPTSPYKFKPEVTSSPSVQSEDAAVPPYKDLKEMDKKSKRSSYIEAMSSGHVNIEPANNLPTKSKSADPLWLPGPKTIRV